MFIYTKTLNPSDFFYLLNLFIMSAIRIVVNGVVVTNPQDLVNENGRYDSISADVRIRAWINSQSK
jgi:hypothetical protein